MDSESAAKRGFRPLQSSIGTMFLVIFLLAIAKVMVGRLGWEILPAGSTIPGMLGGVFFTLAILLSSLLQDFKETERALGEFSSALRRLWGDISLAGLPKDLQKKVHADLGDIATSFREYVAKPSERSSETIHLTLDRFIDRIIAFTSTPHGTMRSVQVPIQVMTRLTDRLEIIARTEFPKIVYDFAGSAIVVVLVGFLLVPIGTVFQSVFLMSFVTFILLGLYLVIRDLDNPLEGTIRVQISQVESVCGFIEKRIKAEALADSATPQS